MDDIFGSVLINETVLEGFRGNIMVWRWVGLREVLTNQAFSVSLNAVGTVYLLTSDEWSFHQFYILLLRCHPDNMACAAVKCVLAVDALVVNDHLAYCYGEVIATVVLAALLLENITVYSRHEV